MAIRRTSKGIQVDMDALIASSSKRTPAVGNMSVNAKGDELGHGGKVVKKNEDRVRDYYKNNTKAPVVKKSLKGDTPSKLEPDSDTAVSKTATTAKAEKKASKPKKVEAPAVDEFDSTDMEPLGYKEVELPNGDIQMVPYYNDDDK